MSNFPPDDDSPWQPDQTPVNIPPRTEPLRLPGDPPVVVYGLLAVTILVFILQNVSQFLMNGLDLPALYGMKDNGLILRGQLWRFITPMFLHGSILHIAFNMYALTIFGRGLERHYGHWRFAALYFVSGFAGNVMSFLFSPAPSLGSSTAIFGLLAAEGVFLYQNREIFGAGAQRALGNIITIGVINLIIGLSPGIDNWGHIGGALGGVLYAFSAGPVLQIHGITPFLTLSDERDGGDAWRTLIAVGALFALLAAATIFIRSR